jgi:hypothetical protein
MKAVKRYRRVKNAYARRFISVPPLPIVGHIARYATYFEHMSYLPVVFVVYVGEDNHDENFLLRDQLP